MGVFTRVLTKKVITTDDIFKFITEEIDCHAKLDNSSSNPKTIAFDFEGEDRVLFVWENRKIEDCTEGEDGAIDTGLEYTTYLRLGSRETSLEIMRLILDEFGGGFIQYNDWRDKFIEYKPGDIIEGEFNDLGEKFIVLSGKRMKV